jgi:GTP-binding protein Era
MQFKKSLLVGILGEPNSGKSSLANAIINYNACMISCKPHTTRESTLAIYTKDEYQIVFTDTPGIGSSLRKDSMKLANIAKRSMEKNDVLVFLFDGTKKQIKPHMIDLIKQTKCPKIALFSKVDIVNRGKLLPLTAQISDYFQDIFYISSITTEGISAFLEKLKEYALDNDWFFDVDTKTNRTLQQMICDRTQEVLFTYLHDEIPYHTKVVIDNLQTKKGEIFIYQNVFIKESYKHIFLSNIKTLSMKSREAVEKLLEKKTHLFLNVKVAKNR